MSVFLVAVRKWYRKKLYVREAGFWLKHLKKAGKKDRIKAINR